MAGIGHLSFAGEVIEARQAHYSGLVLLRHRRFPNPVRQIEVKLVGVTANLAALPLPA
jgi:hypothetical protein